MSKNRKADKVSGAGYWDGIAWSCMDKKSPQLLWRISTQMIFGELLDRWTDNSGQGPALKTDLYDEAVSPYGLIPLLRERYDRVIGMDLSFEVASAAGKRISGDRGSVMVSDVRRLALRSDSIGMVLSHSTLDHFSDSNEIVVSLREIFRVLKPKGTLIITLDNPSNPVICLRNLLPYRLLKTVGIIPYYMGATLSRRKLVSALESNGFKVTAGTAIGHSPRILLIWLGRILKLTSSTRIHNLILRFFGAVERLERLPTRFLTGYFVAVRAIKE